MSLGGGSFFVPFWKEVDRVPNPQGVEGLAQNWAQNGREMVAEADCI